MKAKSLSSNYIFNTILTLSNVLFPLLTFPYISRILGPIGVGNVSYAQSIVQYFVMFAQAGLPVYGIREIAKVRDKKEELSNTFHELFILNFILVIISSIFYMLLFYNNNEMQLDAKLYVILGFSILLNLFTVDWFFGGIEEYKYIAIRGLIIRILSIVLMFLLIHDESDYIKYAALSVFSIFLANILNIYELRKHLNRKILYRKIKIAKHLKPMTLLFVASLIGSIYNNLDVILLGTLASKEYVGYYTTNRRLIQLAIVIVGSLGTVLIPRLSFYINNGLNNEYNKLAVKSINFLYFCSFPMVVYLSVMSKDILLLIGGNKFEAGSFSLSILSVQIIITSLASFFGFQVILANNNEKGIVYSNIAGAIVNIIINVTLIRRIFHDGSSIAIVVSETAVVITQLIIAKKYITFKIFTKQSLQYVYASILPLIILLPYRYFEFSLIKIGISLFLYILIYVLFLYFKKDIFIEMILSRIIKKGEKYEKNL